MPSASIHFQVPPTITPDPDPVPSPHTRWTADELACRFSGLSERKRQILAAITHGETNDQIADRCQLSAKTVEKHITGLFRSTGFEHRLDLAVAFTVWTQIQGIRTGGRTPAG